MIRRTRFTPVASLFRCNGLATMLVYPPANHRSVHRLTLVACTLRMHNNFQLHTHRLHSDGICHPQQQSRRSHAVCHTRTHSSVSLRHRLQLRSRCVRYGNNNQEIPAVYVNAFLDTLVAYTGARDQLVNAGPYLTFLYSSRQRSLHWPAANHSTQRLERHR